MFYIILRYDYAGPEIAKSTVLMPFRVRWKDGEFYDGEGYFPISNTPSE